MSYFERFRNRPEVQSEMSDQTSGADVIDDDGVIDRQVIRNARTGKLEIVSTNEDGSKSVEPYVEPADD